jgi:hypothetical protein
MQVSIVCCLTFLPVYAQMGKAGSYGSTISSFFRGTPKLISTVAGLIYIPTNSVWGCPPISLPAFVFLMIAILTGIRWNLDADWFAFPLWLKMLNTFSWLISYLYFSWKLFNFFWDRVLLYSLSLPNVGIPSLCHRAWFHAVILHQAASHIYYL